MYYIGKRVVNKIEPRSWLQETWLRWVQGKQSWLQKLDKRNAIQGPIHTGCRMPTKGLIIGLTSEYAASS